VGGFLPSPDGFWFDGFRFGGFRFGGFRFGRFRFGGFLPDHRLFSFDVSASWLVPRVCRSWLRATSGCSVVGSTAADDATINQFQELINKKLNYYLVNQFRIFNNNPISLKLKTLMASIAVFHGIDAVFIASM